MGLLSFDSEPVKLGFVQGKGAHLCAVEWMELSLFQIMGATSSDAEWVKLGLVQVKDR